MLQRKGVSDKKKQNKPTDVLCRAVWTDGQKTISGNEARHRYSSYRTTLNQVPIQWDTTILEARVWSLTRVSLIHGDVKRTLA